MSDFYSTTQYFVLFKLQDKQNFHQTADLTFFAHIYVQYVI